MSHSSASKNFVTLTLSVTAVGSSWLPMGTFLRKHCSVHGYVSSETAESRLKVLTAGGEPIGPTPLGGCCKSHCYRCIAWLSSAAVSSPTTSRIASSKQP